MTAEDRRRQLVALWDLLSSFGAVVRRRDPDALPDDVIEALCNHDARRIRALIEGAAAGWTPADRTGQATAHLLAAVAVTNQQNHDQAEKTERALRPAAEPAEDQADRHHHPIRVRHHRPRWRAIA